MARETKKYLFDIREAGRRITVFTAGKSYDDHAGDDLLKSAVRAASLHSCIIPAPGAWPR